MSTVGQFDLQEVLGHGGMATVYRGEHVSGIGLQAAVKILHPHLMVDRDLRARMRLEAQTLARLRHPCIVQLLDFVELDPGYALVMEYVEGRTLEARMRQAGGAPLERAEALHIFGQILEGVGHAHEEGCLHRDIKPANVMVGRGGRVKVLDFGIASLLGPGEQTVEQGVVGTPIYMAPEQLRGGAELDTRADLYALGVVLWELLAGTAARTGSGRKPWRLQRDEVQRLRDHGIPQTLVDLTLDLTAEDPADRPVDVPTAAARFAALVAEGLPPEALLGELALEPTLPGQPDATERATLELGSLSGGAPTVQGTTRLGPPAEASQATTRFRSAASMSQALTIGAAHPADGLATQRRQTNLAGVGEAFVGRTDELRAIVQNFEAGAPIVTLIGAAGTGKSRLASEYGRAALMSYPGGVWRVELAGATGGDALCGAVSRVLDVPLGRHPIDQLGHAIQGRGRTLLILDTFEHLVDQAFDTIGTWSARAPDARFLVTTRVSFELVGAETVPVLPLSPPAPDVGAEDWRQTMLASPAIDLFLRRARVVEPSIEFDDEALADVAAIVRRLDGIPLAIELAAAWAASLSPCAIRERLADRFDLLDVGPGTDTGRNRSTLRGAFQWSWDLLGRDERLVLAQCSVFAGGFDLDAAQAVVALPITDASTTQLVRSLVRKSLLQTDHASDTPRFWLLDTVRAHAAEQLDGLVPFPSVGGSDGIRLRHAGYFALWGDQDALDALDLTGGAERRARLADDLDNLGAAVRNALTDAEPDLAAGCTRAILATCRLRGPYVEGLALTDAVLAAPGLGAPWRCRLLADRGWLRRLAGRSDGALEDLDASLALASQSGDQRVVVEVQTARGIALRERGQMFAARRAFDEANTLSRELGLRAIEGRVLGSLAILSKQEGDHSEAETLYQSALAIHREVGNRRSEGIQLGELALLHLEQGRVAVAAQGWEKALAVLRETGNRRGEAQALGNLGLLCRNEGRVEDAARFLWSGIALQRQVGNRRSEAVQMGNLGDLYLAVDMRDDARQCLDAALAICQETSFRLGEGAFSGSRGELAALDGDYGDAWTHLDRGEALLRDLGNKVELGKLLCRKGRVDLARGDRAATAASLEEAEDLARDLGTGPRAELSRAIDGLRDALHPGSGPTTAPNAGA